MQYFRTAQLYFRSLIECFHIFADHMYNCIAVSSFDNPTLLSGQNAHGGFAFFWKHAFDDYITPLTNKLIFIQSCRHQV